MVGEKITAENEKHGEKNPWEKMAEEAPPFAGETREAKRPKELYRGVTLTWDHFINSTYNPLGGEDLYPPNAPKIDELGRKVVGDGNEYGVYMSTNEQMVDAAYGKLGINASGNPLAHDITLGRTIGRIREPKISITYKIDPKKVEIREPFNTFGHYNNGFDGEEWIADVIPSNAYELRTVGISGDFLHAPDKFDPKRKNLEERIIRRFEERKKHLEFFAETILTAIPDKRDDIGSTDRELFCELFGDNGAVYAIPNLIRTENAAEMTFYLLASNSRDVPNNLDLNLLRQIKKYEKSTGEDASIDVLSATIVSDIERRRKKRMEKGLPVDQMTFAKEQHLLDQIAYKQDLDAKNSHATQSNNES